MKMPTYEQQNEFMRKYIAPLFEFNLAKVLRNYRMGKSGPFTDERMAEIRNDVLANIREKGEKYSDRVYDNTFDSGYDQVREVARHSPPLATLLMTYSKRIRLEDLMQRRNSTEKALPTEESYFDPKRLQQTNWGKIAPKVYNPLLKDDASNAGATQR